jgi:hypothetical protein
MLTPEQFAEFFSEFIDVYDKPDNFYQQKVLSKLNETVLPKERKEEIIKDFVQYACNELQIKKDDAKRADFMPYIFLTNKYIKMPATILIIALGSLENNSKPSSKSVFNVKDPKSLIPIDDISEKFFPEKSTLNKPIHIFAPGRHMS